jgi:hypothetical protein
MSEALVENSKAYLGVRPGLIIVETEPGIIALIRVETQTELL